MLKENINTKWPVYRDRVVRQLVGETEIDFKNSRVRLEAAEYSFPFYSFGARRAYPENLISEPKSNFGKYIISNYGVDETEYKEIYAMYMGIIASRLQDHDENVNHLHLHESTEDNFLNTIVDQLVSETEIDYEENKMKAPFIYTYERHWFSFPLPYSIFVPVTTQFFNHCRDVYGITNEEIRYVWKNYESIILDKLKRIEPLNESIEDNALNIIVDQLVNETRIDYKYKVIHAPFNPHGDSSSFLFSSSPFSSPILLPSLSPPLLFFKYCKDIYGLTKQETEYVWYEYKKTIKNKINNKPLNESTEDNALNTIVDQLMDETDIDYGRKLVLTPFWVRPFSFPFSIASRSFIRHCKDIYGLNVAEIQYVWEEYKKIIKDKIKNKPLNESIEDNALNTIVDQLVSETNIDYDKERVFAPTLLSPDPLLFPSLSSLSLPYLLSSLFFDHCRDMYGLTIDETEYVWVEYRKTIKDKIKNKPLNESTEDNFLDKIVNQLMGETIINWEEKGISYPHLRSCWYYINDPTPHLTLFTNYITNLYGLTKEEANYIWEKYNDSIIHKIDNNREKLGRWRGGEALNESTGKNFLDNIINKLVGETKLGEKMVFFGDMRAPFNHFPAIRSTEYFIRHCKDYYGLTENEIDYVWKQYKQIIEYKIKSQTSLNENMDKQYKFLEWVISDIKDKTYMQIHERPVIGGFYSTNPLHFIDPIDREESVWRFMYKHYETYYGLTMDEMFYVVERVYPWVAETFLTDYSND